MNVLIRADGSPEIGLGHLVRCRSLADELSRKGVAVTLAARHLPDQMEASYHTAGHEVIRLRAAGPDAVTGDVEELIEATGGQRFDWCVLDHYGLGFEWEQKADAFCDRLLVVDDFGDREHAGTLLLDQNFGSEAHSSYRELAPGTRLLLGPRFALLDQSYQDIKPRARFVPSRGLIFFGGADLDNVTSIALEAFSEPELDAIHLDVVIGSANPHGAEIRSRVLSRGKATLHPMQPSLAGLMNEADFAVGAGGSTNWERLYCGLPSVVVSVADNQVPVCQALASDDLIDYAGDRQSLTPAALAHRLRSFLADLDRFALRSIRGSALVDARGACRVAEVMYPTPRHVARLRTAAEADCLLYFAWANDPASRENSLNNQPIPWDGHERWFSSRLRSSDSHLFVLETPQGLPLGQIRFDAFDGDSYRLSFSVDAFARGRQWGRRLVELGLDQMSQLVSGEILAEVRETNVPSSCIFKALGFELRERYDGVERHYIRLN